MLPRTVCLRFPNCFVLLHAKRAERYARHARYARCGRRTLVLRARGMFHSCTLSDSATLFPFLLHAPRYRARHIPFMYPRASRSFSRFTLARHDCNAIIARCFWRSRRAYINRLIKRYIYIYLSSNLCKELTMYLCMYACMRVYV
jgi:hypothetical protein